MKGDMSIEFIDFIYFVGVFVSSRLITPICPRKQPLTPAPPGVINTAAHTRRSPPPTLGQPRCPLFPPPIAAGCAPQHRFCGPKALGEERDQHESRVETYFESNSDLDKGRLGTRAMGGQEELRNPGAVTRIST